jgi:hypothetical protein
VDQLAATTVRVVINSFEAMAKDGHLAFKNGTDAFTVPYATFNFVSAMQAKVAAASPIAPATDGRITIVGGCGRPLSQP